MISGMACWCLLTTDRDDNHRKRWQYSEDYPYCRPSQLNASTWSSNFLLPLHCIHEIHNVCCREIKVDEANFSDHCIVGLVAKLTHRFRFRLTIGEKRVSSTSAGNFSWLRQPDKVKEITRTWFHIWNRQQSYNTFRWGNFAENEVTHEPSWILRCSWFGRASWCLNPQNRWALLLISFRSHCVELLLKRN